MSKFAREKVAPLVKEMDEKEELDRSIMDGLFEQGVSDGTAIIDVIMPACCASIFHYCY